MNDNPTKRELEILILIAAGKTDEEIAKHFGISVNTVNSHRKKLLQKAAAANVAQLIAIAMRRGWIE